MCEGGAVTRIGEPPAYESKRSDDGHRRYWRSSDTESPGETVSGLTPSTSGSRWDIRPYGSTAAGSPGWSGGSSGARPRSTTESLEMALPIRYAGRVDAPARPRAGRATITVQGKSAETCLVADPPAQIVLDVPFWVRARPIARADGLLGPPPHIAESLGNIGSRSPVSVPSREREGRRPNLRVAVAFLGGENGLRGA